MKTPQAIFGALVVALALAAFIMFYDNSEPDTQTAPDANEVAEKTDLLTPASSIAHDFAVLPKIGSQYVGDFDRGRVCRVAEIHSHSPGAL